MSFRFVGWFLVVVFLMCTRTVPNCMYVHHIRASACEGQMRVSNTLELELLMTVRYHLGFGDLTWVFRKSSQCS